MDKKNQANVYLAIDLGASSGRAIIGRLDAQSRQLELEEIHRFEHHPCPTPVGPIWDLTGIWLNIVQGLKLAGSWCQQNNAKLCSVGVDTWGVDWTLVGPSGEQLGQSHCYRDPQNIAASERVLEKLGGKHSLYERTGVQHMFINSIFQIAARLEQAPELFSVAERLLFVPDLFHYWLSGEMTNERTIASTSGLLSVKTGEWDWELIKELGFPESIFGELIEPGVVVGKLLPELAQIAGVADEVAVIAPGTHDTASAIAAVPFESQTERSPEAKEDAKTTIQTYLSSGTWSLLGAELADPFVSKESCEVPFTNERGLESTVRFLKNIGGLWLVQELRREYLEQGNEISFDEMTEQARLADPFRTLIDPNAPQFATPRAMAEKIRTFARQTDQLEPETLGDLVRCCLDSLALCYRATVDQLETVLNGRVETLHIVGGGVQNRLLNEITCGVMNRPILCGPVEATAIGNLLTQAVGNGQLNGLDDIRGVVRESFEVETFLPDEVDSGFLVGDDVLQRYQELVQADS
ncbi:MAG: rhamnulokinase family protein [Planctomycetota bacterium]